MYSSSLHNFSFLGKRKENLVLRTMSDPRKTVEKHLDAVIEWDEAFFGKSKRNRRSKYQMWMLGRPNDRAVKQIADKTKGTNEKQ